MTPVLHPQSAQAHGPTPAPGLVPRFAANLLLAAIRLYQAALRPIMPSACRFAPSCSDYAAEAVARHGPARGAWLAIRRVLRSHP
jgi:putative membrane protein insertion efficiency factor